MQKSLSRQETLVGTSIMKAFLQLIRWRNILIIFLTQAVIWYFVILPLEDLSTIFFLYPTRFLLLSFSTICIAAAGYIINDYFDVKIDAINKPDKLIIGKKINRRSAILMHSVLNAIGILIAAYLCYSMHDYLPILIQIGTSLLLWFYSTHFKRQFIIGNIVVAMLTALTVLTLVFYEPSLFSFINFNFFIIINNNISPNPFWVLMVYAFFAFMLTWMREIVKDMEDFRGDAEEGCDTMPIRLGLNRSTRWVMVMGIVAVLPLCFAAVRLIQVSQKLLGFYIIIGLIMPLVIVMYLLPKNTTQKHYATISTWLKYIMVLGILALTIYR